MLSFLTVFIVGAAMRETHGGGRVLFASSDTSETWNGYVSLHSFVALYESLFDVVCSDTWRVR